MTMLRRDDHSGLDKVPAPERQHQCGNDDTTTDMFSSTVRRMVWELSPAKPGPLSRSLRDRRVVVVGGDDTTAARVARELRHRGAAVLEQPAPGAAADESWLDEIPDTIVDLTISEPLALDDPSPWRVAFLRTIDLLRRCHATWSSETSASGVAYLAVTYMGGGMGRHPDDDVAQPLGGLWAGLTKTLHREFPNCLARVVDVGPADATRLPELIAAELSRAGCSEIGYRDRRRWSLTPRAASPGPAVVCWDADDTVLVSGGGRGIGFALATELASRFGARVIVTGRGPLSTQEIQAQLSPEERQRRRTQLWSQHRHGRPIQEIRRELARMEGMWEVAGNLAQARAQGLRIEYRACDFTDPAAVYALVEELPELTAVVHNAGADRPARLPRKSDADISAIVATKVDSFLYLLRALRERDLKLLCNVGSLTGRLGGMVGQVDYAAANECLARLGLWAGRQVDFPVLTLAWPTWNRLGLVANFEASLRYMSALDVEEGLRHWHREFEAGSQGEVTFVGRIGRALDPQQATSYPLAPALPGFVEMYPKIFHLGTVREYRPHQFLLCEVELTSASLSAVGDMVVHGAPAVPASLLIENAVRAAEWIYPEHVPELLLTGVEGVRIPLSLLKAVDGRVRLRRAAKAARRGRQWVVHVTFSPIDRDSPQAQLCVVRSELDTETGTAEALRDFARGGGAPAGPGYSKGSLTPASPDGHTVRTASTAAGQPDLAWRGAVVPVSSWYRDAVGQWITRTRRCPPADLWTVPEPPAGAIPVTTVENVLRAVASEVSHEATPAGTIGTISADHLALVRPEPHESEIVGDPRARDWCVRDAETGGPVAFATGLAVSSEQARTGAQTP